MKIKSKTILWGDIQVFAGLAVVALGFIQPSSFPDLPPYAYGLASMLAGLITYILRTFTRLPLSEK